MKDSNELIWTSLVHISMNMWKEEDNPTAKGPSAWQYPGIPKIRFDEAMFDEHIRDLKAAGCNSVMLDLGDAIQYKSHPEIACEGALTVEKAMEKFEEIKAMGMDIIPKLNFSSSHDHWMKDYSRMLSTPIYYQVVKDLIDEVCDMLHPKYFHVGMDEETYGNQDGYNYVVIRQNDLWWHDFYYVVDCVEKNGARAIMWADRAREDADEIIAKCPRSVVMGAWYYFDQFQEPFDELCWVRVRPFTQLAEAGFDILACGSVEYFDDNLEKLTDYCKRKIVPERLLGFAQTTWTATMPEWREKLDKGVISLRNSKLIYEGKMEPLGNTGKACPL